MKGLRGWRFKLKPTPEIGRVFTTMAGHQSSDNTPCRYLTTEAWKRGVPPKGGGVYRRMVPP